MGQIRMKGKLHVQGERDLNCGNEFLQPFSIFRDGAFDAVSLHASPGIDVMFTETLLDRDGIFGSQNVENHLVPLIDFFGREDVAPVFEEEKL